jgi:DNA-binding MarR family transcriptional regulator
MPRRDVNPTAEIAKALAKLEKASFGDILKEADISRQALDIHLKRMLDKKLILSERDPRDKRKYLYWLNPNELAIITIDEAIESIKNELKAIGEELKPEEEQKLREWLIKHFRAILIEELKADFPIAEYGIIRHLFDWLTSLTLVKLLIGEEPEEGIDRTEEFIKTIFPKASFYHGAVKAIIDLPNSIAEKWSKTKAFSTNPAVIILDILETGKFKLS